MRVDDNVAWYIDINVDAEVYKTFDGIVDSGVDVEVETYGNENNLIRIWRLSWLWEWQYCQ